MDPTVPAESIYAFSKGNIVLDGFITDVITIIGLEYDHVDIIKTFLEKLNILRDAKIERIYSPQDLLLSPYITYIKSIYNEIIDYPTFQRLAEKAVSEYSAQNYSLCIGTMGIMAEDILTQIYETLFRVEFSGNLTLGQMYDQIHIDMKQIISPKTKEQRQSSTDIFLEINNIDNNLKQTSVDVSQKESINILRKMLQYQVDQENILKDMIKEIKNPKSELSIFPKKIQNNFNDLLRYRNAISHKSKIPIGQFEAVLTFYCTVTLLLWWNEEKKVVDWKLSKEEIIKKIIERNTHVTILQ